MTAQTDFERTLATWLTDERPTAAPDGLLQAVTDRVAETPRRPGWLVPDRWTWSWSVSRVRSTARVAVIAAAVILLVLAAVAAVILAGSPRPAPPFGLANAGLIAFDAAEGVVVSRADGSERRVVSAGSGQRVSPTWSRDGLRLAFWSRAREAEPWDLIVWDSHLDRVEQLASGVTLRAREALFGWPSNITWSPDSRRLAFAADVDAERHGIFVAALGNAQPVLITDPDLRSLDPAWAPDGTEIAYQSARDGTLHAIAPDGAGERAFTQPPQTSLWPDWAPDGTRIAVMGRGQANDIYVVSRNGSVLRNVSDHPTDEYSPTWSPDGSRLAWARVPADGSARAWVVTADADGTNQIEIREPADLAPPMWAPDGTRIYSYVANEVGAFNALVVLDPNGVAPVTRIPAEGNVGNGNWQRLP